MLFHRTITKLVKAIAATTRRSNPIFCIITPVFDEALASVKSLMSDVLQQDYPHFLHILISNGASHEIKQHVRSVKDSRFVYYEYPCEATPDFRSLFLNLSRRRDCAIRTFKGDRYFFFDADIEIINTNYLRSVALVHHKADVILVKVAYEQGFLPIEPILLGGIDIANYSFSDRIARKYGYPVDIDPRFFPANDYRCFDKIRAEKTSHVDMVFARKDGRKWYLGIQERYRQELTSPKGEGEGSRGVRRADCDRRDYAE